jgi:type IX secretion system substrate protein
MKNKAKSRFFSRKTRINLFVFFTLCFTGTLFAQPVEEWVNFIGENSVYTINLPVSINLNDIDAAGNSYIAGVNQNVGSYNVFTAKFDKNGNQQWIINNNTATWIPKGFCMKQAGKFVYVVYEDSNSIITNKYRTNSGNLEWTATRNIGYSCYPMSIDIDKNENVYIACSEFTTVSNTIDYTITKYDKTGIQLFVALYDGGRADEPIAVLVDDNQNFYVTGSSLDSVSSNYATVKFDINGVMQWAARYNGPANRGSGASCMELDATGVYVSGISLGSLNFEIATLKYDLNGNVLWEQRYSQSNLFHNSFDLAVDQNHNVYVTGGDAVNIALIKYDANGGVLWTRQHSGDKGYSVALDDKQRNVYVTGNINIGGGIRDGITMKYDSAGTLLWEAMYDRGVGGSDRPMRVKTDSHCGIYIAGFSQNSANVYENFILKYDECPHPSPFALNSDLEIPHSFNLYQNYPNPFNPSTKIKFDIPEDKGNSMVKIKVYDITGKEVANLLDRELQPGTHEVEFDGSNLASGTYFYRLEAGQYTDIKKMILIK